MINIKRRKNWALLSHAIPAIEIPKRRRRVISPHILMSFILFPVIENSAWTWGGKVTGV